MKRVLSSATPSRRIPSGDGETDFSDAAERALPTLAMVSLRTARKTFGIASGALVCRLTHRRVVDITLLPSDDLTGKVNCPVTVRIRYRTATGGRTMSSLSHSGSVDSTASGRTPGQHSPNEGYLGASVHLCLLAGSVFHSAHGIEYFVRSRTLRSHIPGNHTGIRAVSGPIVRVRNRPLPSEIDEPRSIHRRCGKSLQGRDTVLRNYFNRTRRLG